MTYMSFFNLVFFFNDTATTEIYTLSLHDALPISGSPGPGRRSPRRLPPGSGSRPPALRAAPGRSEEHTSELQSRLHLVCRLLLEKKTHKVPTSFADLFGTGPFVIRETDASVAQFN